MKIIDNADLTGWNTFGMRVSCACFVEYSAAEELESLWNPGGRVAGGAASASDAASLPRPFLHIGRGSNLLFRGDFPGTVFHSDIRYIEPLVRPDDMDSGDRVRVKVGAGIVWDDFCRWCASCGFWGVENLSGIPGEVGAAAVQNIGAYGVEVGDVISEVECFDCVTGSKVTFTASECRYGYRDSIFKDTAKGRYVVTSVEFSLSRVPAPKLDYGHLRAAVEAAGELTPSAVREAVLSIRSSKLPDPAVTGSAGSFFKNPIVPRSDYVRVASIAGLEWGESCQVPHYDAGSGFVKIPAAWLIEHCGLKGYRIGGAAVYERQPLVIVNLTGTALPEDVLAVEEHVVKSVYDKFGIRLTPEVEHV